MSDRLNFRLVEGLSNDGEALTQTAGKPLFLPHGFTLSAPFKTKFTRTFKNSSLQIKITFFFSVISLFL